MISAVILIGALAMAASAPTYQMPAYVINVDEAGGRHVQMGEPGKAVSGYFTSRSLDGAMEYKTMYEADHNGFRVRGDHLPSSSLPDPEGRSPGSAPAYIFKYDNAGPNGHSHYLMGEPGKAVQGSYMFYDTQGRAQRVDYEADENGYRVKPAAPEAPEISSGTVVKAVEPVAEAAPVAEPAPAVEAVAVPAVADPAPAVAEPVVAEIVPVSVPVAAAEPAPAAEPVVAARGRPDEVYFNMYNKYNMQRTLNDESVPSVVAAEPIPAPVVAAEPEAAAVVADVKVEPAVEAVVVPAAADPAPAVAEPVVASEVKAAEPKVVVTVPQPGVAYFRGSLPYVQPAFHYPAYPYGFGYPYYGGNYFYTI